MNPPRDCAHWVGAVKVVVIEKGTIECAEVAMVDVGAIRILSTQKK